MYIYNPDISEEENFKNLLIESGYLEEHLKDVKITKIIPSVSGSLSKLEVAYSGIVARGFGTNKSIHEYDRVLPLIKEGNFETEKQIEPFKIYSREERQKTILSKLKEEPQFVNNNQLDKYNFKEKRNNLDVGLFEYVIKLNKEDNCVFGTQEASVYIVKDYKKTDIEKSIELPGIWQISKYGFSSIDTLTSADSKRTWSLFSQRPTGEIYNSDYHKELIKYYKEREDPESEFVDSTNAVRNERNIFDYSVGENIIQKPVKLINGVEHEYGNEFVECFCDLKDPYKTLGIRGTVVSYIWYVDIDHIFKRHIDKTEWQSGYKYSSSSSEKRFKSIPRKETVDLPEIVALEKFNYLFEYVIDSPSYNYNSNLEMAKYLSNEVVNKSKGVVFNIELLHEEDKFEHVIYYKLKNMTALKEGMKITKGNVILKIIVRDSALPIFPNPKNQLSGYEMI